MTYILNPQVSLQKEFNRVLMYYLDPFNGVSDVHFIELSDAIILSLFDGTRDEEQILREIGVLQDVGFSTESMSMEKHIKSIHDKWVQVPNLLVDVEMLPPALRVARYNPRDWISLEEQVTITSAKNHLGFPMQIHFSMTGSCPGVCKYCDQPLAGIPLDISLERFLALFQECKEKGCTSIVLAGGDPLLHPDIITIMSILRAEGLHYTLTTKSFLDKETCLVLKKKAGMQYIQLKLDSADPVIAASLAGMGQDFLANTIESVKNLHKVDIDIKLKCVVTGYNADYLDEYLKLCRELGVSRVEFVPYVGTNVLGCKFECKDEREYAWKSACASVGKCDAVSGNNDGRIPSVMQIKRVKEVIGNFKARYARPIIEVAARDFLEISGAEVAPENLPTQYLPAATTQTHLYVLPNGEVTRCPNQPYSPRTIVGDLRQSTIEEIWHSLP